LIFGFNFQREILWTESTARWTADRAGPWWTTDRWRGSASLARGARALELVDDGGGGRTGRGGARELLTGDGVGMRWHTGGNERRWLELIARAEEGTKKLGREGTRCGEGRGGLIALL
jgi:hypothetical protein